MLKYQGSGVVSFGLATYGIEPLRLFIRQLCYHFTMKLTTITTDIYFLFGGLLSSRRSAVVY